ncbi:unnamed protein product, partial [Candidula unifasciata]
DIKDTTVGTLSQQITAQLMGLKGLHSHMDDISGYLKSVAEGRLPINHQIVYQLQDVFNLLPDVGVPDLVHSLTVSTNDQMSVVYLASLVRSIMALHNLINNKVQNRDAEKNEGKDSSKDKKDTKEKGDEKSSADKEKDKKDGSKDEKDAKKSVKK